MNRKLSLLLAALLCLFALFGAASAFADDDIAPPPMGENAQTLPETTNTAPQPPAPQPESGGNGGGSAASAPAQNPPAQNAPASNTQPAQSNSQSVQGNSQSVQLTPIGTPQPAPTTTAAPTSAAAAPSPTPEAAPMESAPPEPSAPAETPGDGADRYLRVAVVLGLSGMVVVALALNGASKRRKRRGKRRR